MEFHNEVDVSKLLGAQTHIINHIFSYVNSMSLKCAVDLGIPDAINSHGQPMPFSELISSLPIHPSKSRYVYRLMRFLIHSGFFAQQKISEDDPEEGYVLTDASKLLLKENPSSLIPLVILMTDQIFINPGFVMSSWLKNGDIPSPFEMANGMSLWEYAGKNPKLSQVLNEAMGNDATMVSSVVIEKCKCVFEGLESLVDVGGGTGNLAKAIAKEFPKLECTVFDLPYVVSGLQGTENLRYVGGDMFQAIPPTNAIMFKWVLCDWNDEDCVKILKNCKEAIERKGKEGKVIIIDMVIENGKGKNDDDESAEAELLFDMMAMLAVKGRERNEKEWADVFYSAGFNDYKITPRVLNPRSLIEVYP